MDAERLLDGLDEAQLRAVTAEGGPVVVLAGAGSGKTRVLTRRIAWRVVRGETDPQRVLTLTFTRKAAAELRQRQRRLGLRDPVPAGTLHSFALAQLRQRWEERRTVPPAVVNRKARLLGPLVARRPGVELAELIAEIDWARARLIEPEGYADAARRAGRTPPVPAGELAELMVRYQQAKRRKRVVDFDDLLSLAIRDLRADPNYREAVRWRHRHFYVDEFQDVNPLQLALLEAWLGDRSDLFLVGDPNQSIYAWNGADPELLTGQASRPDATVIELSANYRSSPQILSAAGAALGAGMATRFRATGTDGPHPTITAHRSDSAEAEGVAEAIRSARSVGEPWSDQAVLVRTNAQLVLIERALAERHIPARVRGGPGPLGTPEVRRVLRALGTHHSDLVRDLEELDTRLAEPTGAVGGIAPGRRDELLALSKVVHEYLSVDPRPTGPGLLAWIDTLQRGDLDEAADAVDLATFHGAKGLEWPVVHVAGLEDGFVPIAYAQTAAQHAEERRLLYVALTRAERQLHLSWAAERTFGNQATARSPSPLLDRVAAAIADLDPARPGTTDWRTRIHQTRTMLAPEASPPEPADVDEAAVLDALRSWRTRKARAGGVPPHVIVPDQLLQAVAGHRPTTASQLASLPGMRPTRLSRYGDEILAVVLGGSSPA